MQSLRLDAYWETTASSRTRKVHSSQQVRIHNPHTLGLLTVINVCRESTCNLSDRNPRRENRKKNPDTSHIISMSRSVSTHPPLFQGHHPSADVSATPPSLSTSTAAAGTTTPPPPPPPAPTTTTRRASYRSSSSRKERRGSGGREVRREGTGAAAQSLSSSR